MKIKDIYELAIKKGMGKDPRSIPEIRKELAKIKKEYQKLKGMDRQAFDMERLVNPYADTRILYGDPDMDVKKVIVGVDMEAPEIIAVGQLNDRGEAIDLVMAHHPEGIAWSRLYDVMKLQVASLKKFGIPLEVGEELLKSRMGEVERSVAPSNHFRSIDIARLLDIPFMCVHTPADNHVAHYLQELFDKKKPGKLSEVVAMLKRIPEYIDGMKKNAGPRILIGEPDKKAGKIFVDMTGGTEGPKRVFPRLSQAGVGTVVGMHFSEEHFKYAKDEHINIVIAGHIASDNLGLNLFLDELEKVECLKIVPCSGFVRVRR